MCNNTEKSSSILHKLLFAKLKLKVVLFSGYSLLTLFICLKDQAWSEATEDAILQTG